MPRIIINEIDETVAGESVTDVDIAYIPGFAATNTNCYIFTEIGAAPTTATAGDIWDAGDTYDTPLGTGTGENTYPSYAINTSDKKVWKCTNITGDPGSEEYEWTLQDTYEAPHPENYPTLCTTVSDFEDLFGKNPYKFTTAQSYANFDPAPSPSVMYAVGDYEKSYIMAKELITAGIPVLYENVVERNTTQANISVKAEPTIAFMYSALAGTDGCLENLKDKGTFSVKYITTGAYPIFEYNSNALVSKALEVAAERGDAIAIIDHSNYPGRPLKTTSGTNSVYNAVSAASLGDNAVFGTMFTPWAVYSLPNAPATAVRQVLPASFAYLMSLGRSIQTNANWLAIAGVARGQVPYIQSLNTVERLTNTIADAYQPRDGVAINAITNIMPYGLTIWGNRTLKKNTENLVAFSFLNIRNLTSDVKKLAYNTAKKLMFEQNSTVLWLNFKSAITPLLDRMQSGFGISGYKIIQQPTTEKAKVKALIRLYPVYAVEEFEITVVMSDEDVSVS